MGWINRVLRASCPLFAGGAGTPPQKKITFSVLPKRQGALGSLGALSEMMGFWKPGRNLKPKKITHSCRKQNKMVHVLFFRGFWFGFNDKPLGNSQKWWFLTPKKPWCWGTSRTFSFSRGNNNVKQKQHIKKGVICSRWASFRGEKIFASIFFQTQISAETIHLSSKPRWWFQPIWKMLVNLEIFPKFRGENNFEGAYNYLCEEVTVWTEFWYLTKTPTFTDFTGTFILTLLV